MINAITNPGIPNKPVSIIIIVFTAIPIPKKAHIHNTIPPIMEFNKNLNIILNGNAIISRIANNIAIAIKKDKKLIINFPFLTLDNYSTHRMF